MKIIIIGASGKIGREIDNALAPDHNIIRVGVTSGDIQCDITSTTSITNMFNEVGPYDALFAVAGRDTTFKPFETLKDDDFRYGFERKFLGQIRLVMQGQETIRDNGLFVITTGFLSDYPNPNSIATGPFNSAIDTFVRQTAPLLPRGIRINAVSPAPVVEPGREKPGLVTAEQTAQFYIEALNGNMTGDVLRAWGGLQRPELT